MDLKNCSNQSRRCISERSITITEAKTLQLKKSLPKKSAYYIFGSSRGTTSDETADDVKRIPVKHTDTHSQKDKHADKHSQKDMDKPTATGMLPSPVKGSIFKTPARNHVDIAEDVIRADCMNHGYRIERTIGEGAYAKVKLAEVLPSKFARNEKLAEIAYNCENETLFVAIKVIESKNVPKEFLKKFLPRELSNHCPLPPHRNVVEVYEQFKTEGRYYVVMEYCSRGDLLDLINQKISESSKGVGEDRARVLFRMMTEGVHHIHSNGIVHRDLKCENILLNHENNIKITDFGFSTQFIPEKTALLKTSCGSFAYTAPEIIRMKPYDGTKSDIWSLGIILFAMLNGRLPFNDSQLAELEEDMKMQRLRFERTASFESMVLVRRILQYNPTNRPTTVEILTDPWLTGARMIPRQVNKPNWLNPHQKTEDEEVSGTKASYPLYYNTAIPERNVDATVTVNHDKNETVVLKSRTGNKKNIWTCGPPISSRPNTWPKQDKSKPSERGSRDSKYKQTKATAIVKQSASHNKCPIQSNKDGGNDKESTGTEKFTNWFMEKYMTAKEAGPSNCSCSKAAAAVTNAGHTKQAHFDDKEPELCFRDNDDNLLQDVDDYRFQGAIRHVGDCSMDVNVNDAKLKSKLDDKQFKVKKSVTPKVDQSKQQRNSISSRTNSRSGNVSACSGNRSSRTTPSPSARPTNKCSSLTHGPSAIKNTGYTSLTMSKSVDVSRKKPVHFQVNKSTSPAERVKYFRDRLMRLYGNERTGKENISGLPPLMVQALEPPKLRAETRGAPASAPPRNGRIRRTSVKIGNIRCKSSTVKPVQRTIIH